MNIRYFNNSTTCSRAFARQTFAFWNSSYVPVRSILTKRRSTTNYIWYYMPLAAEIWTKLNWILIRIREHSIIFIKFQHVVSHQKIKLYLNSSECPNCRTNILACVLMCVKTIRKLCVFERALYQSRSLSVLCFVLSWSYIVVMVLNVMANTSNCDNDVKTSPWCLEKRDKLNMQ